MSDATFFLAPLTVAERRRRTQPFPPVFAPPGPPRFAALRRLAQEAGAHGMIEAVTVIATLAAATGFLAIAW